MSVAVAGSSSASSATAVVCYCRAGFEPECTQEIQALAQEHALDGSIETDTGAGYVVYNCTSDETSLRGIFDWRHLIFARQSLIAFARFENLPRKDRLTPMLDALAARGEVFADVWVESPDSDAGKELTALCKSFGNAMVGALRQRKWLDTKSRKRLHVFFASGDVVFLASAEIDHSAPWPLGIPRLKFPREAPSRSTLKLEEALFVLLSADERAKWLKPAMTAVDLGAAPGGWTWQLAYRSIRVTAIDNGPMDRALLQSGLVTHLREDGFRFRPRKPVDWLVCDMVEQPRRIAALIAQWLADGLCRYTVFNLKLPMKKRFEETRLCLDIVGAHASDVRARQLYHDREEITVFARR
ncbi:MAG: 23S rRNA (cytidine(2498)-2'-O)-methyltransferase RlmM [Rudaea sp.]